MIGEQEEIGEIRVAIPVEVAGLGRCGVDAYLHDQGRFQDIAGGLPFAPQSDFTKLHSGLET